MIIDRRHPRWNRYGDRIVFLERRYKVVEIEPAIHAICWGIQYFIYHVNTGELHELEGIPKELDADRIGWMDQGESLVFSAYERTLFKEQPEDEIFPQYRFYKYHIATAEISDLAAHPGEPLTVDWIRDDAHDPVYAVSPGGKLTTLWGELKRNSR